MSPMGVAFISIVNAGGGRVDGWMGWPTKGWLASHLGWPMVGKGWEGMADGRQGVAEGGRWSARGGRESFLVPKAHPPPFHGLLGIHCRLNLKAFE